jgi:hypothetical protein
MIVGRYTCGLDLETDRTSALKRELADRLSARAIRKAKNLEDRLGYRGGDPLADAVPLALERWEPSPSPLPLASHDRVDCVRSQG